VFKNKTRNNRDALPLNPNFIGTKLNHQVRKLAIAIAFLLFCLPAMAQKASYAFCVKSSDFESFKAVLIFESVDFGAQSARLVLEQTLEAKLKTQITLTPYTTAANCGCSKGDCPKIELVASKINGSFQTRYKSNSSGPATTAISTLDKVVSETKKVINDPKGALTEAVKQGIALLDKFFD
jgi:hypothetical protein